MGIEQILLPILGGIAKGTSVGMEERRQQRMQMEAQRDAGMARNFFKNPELYEVPEVRNWANKYYGPQEAKAMYSAARIEKLQNQYLLDERVRTGNPNPEPLSPEQLPPEPTFADFSGGGGGNQGAIMGLISQFIPGAQAAMSKLGIGPGTAEAQMSPPSSTGPPSGPQGYPPPGGWQAAGAPQAGQIIGYLKSGRPVVQNADGSTSTHRNMIAGFGDKFYIVPTIYGGKEVTPDQAAQIAQQNNLTDPDTGQKLVGYPTQQAAEQAEQSLHAQLEKEPMMPLSATNARQGMDQRIGLGAIGQVPITQAVPRPGGGAVLTIQGTPPARGTKSAFTRQRPQKIAKGVTISYDKDGNAKVSMTSVDDNLSTNMNEVARRLIDANRPEGQKLDMENSDDIALVINSANTLSAAASAAKTRAVNTEELLQLQDPSWQAAQRSLSKTKAGGGEEGVFEIKSRPDVRLFERNRKREEQVDVETGKLLGQTTEVKLEDGTKTTVLQAEQNQQKALAAARAAGTPLGEGETRLQQTNEALVDAVGEIARLYKPEYVGRIHGNNWYKELQDVMGTFTGEQAQFWQAYSRARNLRAQQLMGASVSILDAERVADEMFDPGKSPTAFAARLQGFDRAAKNTMVRTGELLGRPRGESLAPRPSTPAATIPPAANTPAATPNTPTPIPVPSATTRKPIINKDKNSPYFGREMKTDPNVPLNDPTATGPTQEMVVRESAFNNPQDRAAVKEQIRQLNAQGIRVRVRKMPNEEYDNLEKQQAQEGK